MKVYELIKILANVCKYNAEGEVIMELPDGTQLPLQKCILDTTYNNKRACAVISVKS